MFKTIEAYTDEMGNLLLLGDEKLPKGRKVLVTVLEPLLDEKHEISLISQNSLATDWENDEEDKAWKNLRQAK